MKAAMDATLRHSLLLLKQEELIMKITKIERQKRNEEKVNVYVDEKYRFSMTLNSLLGIDGIKVGDEITEDDIMRLQQKDEGQLALLKVFDIVSRSLQTEYNIRKKLIEKKFSDEAIDYAIEKAKGYNYINDETYVKSFVQYRAIPNKWGEKKVLQELYLKGIDRQFAEPIVKEYCEDYIMFENACALAKKKLNSLKGLEEYKQRNKIYYYLSMKGYSYDIISSVLNKIFEEGAEDF